MNQEAFSEYLTDRYQAQIGWYDTKAASNQAIYRSLQWPVIVLAAITPVLIEMDMGASWGPAFRHLPTATAAIVAILTAGLSTFKYQENWINYRATCEALQKEKHFYDAGVGDYGGAEDKEALFVERIESLISRENTMWISTQKSKASPEQKGEAE